MSPEVRDKLNRHSCSSLIEYIEKLEARSITELLNPDNITHYHSDALDADVVLVSDIEDYANQLERGGQC